MIIFLVIIKIKVKIFPVWDPVQHKIQPVLNFKNINCMRAYPLSTTNMYGNRSKPGPCRHLLFATNSVLSYLRETIFFGTISHFSAK